MYEFYNKDKQKYMELHGSEGISFEKWLYMNQTNLYEMYRSYDLILDVSQEELDAKYFEDRTEFFESNQGDSEMYERFLYTYAIWGKFYLNYIALLDNAVGVNILFLNFLMILSIIYLIYFIRFGKDENNFVTKIALLVIYLTASIFAFVASIYWKIDTFVYLEFNLSIVIISIFIICLILLSLFYKTIPKEKIKKKLKQNS